MSEQPIRIGHSLSLSGTLASNGKIARLGHQIWQNDVNRKDGPLGRQVEMICIDDETNPKFVPEIYKRLQGDGDLLRHRRSVNFQRRSHHECYSLLSLHRSPVDRRGIRDERP